VSVDLKGQPWIVSERSMAVMAALEAVGGTDCARFVGGCVRNALLGAPVDDVDIATQLEPHRTVEALEASAIRVVPTGIDHGTVTAIVKGQPFEITTLRQDVETDGRHAVVSFTTDWAKDAARRDFRLNALYASADGTLHDPTGEGVKDALNGRIVFVGEPEQRIQEDYLRILRFYRFQAWYGQGKPDEAGSAACAALADGVKTLSAERVSKELLKLLSARDPREAVQAMAEAGVLGALIPEADTAYFVGMVRATPDALLRLSSLLPQDAGQVADIASRLRLSNAQRDRLVAAVAPFDDAMNDHSARIMIWTDGADTFVDRTFRAQAMGAEADRMGALRALAASWSVPALPVSGRDLALAGIKPGPQTGLILKAFTASWLTDDFPAQGHDARLHAAIAEVVGSGD